MGFLSGRRTHLHLAPAVRFGAAPRSALALDEDDAAHLDNPQRRIIRSVGIAQHDTRKMAFVISQLDRAAQRNDAPGRPWKRLEEIPAFALLPGIDYRPDSFHISRLKGGTVRILLCLLLLSAPVLAQLAPEAKLLSGGPITVSESSRTLRRGNGYVGRIAARAKDALRRGDVIRVMREENVVDKSLGIAIVKRKPCALDLHHDPVTLKESVIVGV